jgi:hypothetical protein
LRAALGVSFPVSIHGNGVAAHIGHIKAAAVGVQRQCHRFSAKVALMRQAGIEVALHGELAGIHIHGGNGIAVGQRDVEGPSIGRELQSARVRAGSDWAGRLEQGELSAHGSPGQVEFHNLRRVPQGDKGASAVP